MMSLTLIELDFVKHFSIQHSDFDIFFLRSQFSWENLNSKYDMDVVTQVKYSGEKYCWKNGCLRFVSSDLYYSDIFNHTSNTQST